MTKIRAGQISSGAATDGQVLTADGAGVAAWEDAAGGGATYRQYTYIDNGDGTWSFVTNDDGMPVFALLDTE